MLFFSYLVTSGEDGYVKVFDARTYRVMHQYVCHSSSPLLDISQTGLLAISTGKHIQVFVISFFLSLFYFVAFFCYNLNFFFFFWNIDLEGCFSNKTEIPLFASCNSFNVWFFKSTSSSYGYNFLSTPLISFYF